ncbi:hypothetical protein [Hymenobacter ruricola]|uniref:Uncharacterized protein n=1 Tax=Hymenobacter ruricola TaxID=2791023 RepID=A0ABS0I0P0_9BACT|nr:hypothetical protein [Hymenobacter ruricola]MBF9220503.1 hypothetical protein [Hymenobacter ruricola]
MNDLEAQPPADQPPVAPEPVSGAALLTAPSEPAAHTPVYAPQPAEVQLRPLPSLPPLVSEDGRVTLTDTTLSVRGQGFLLLELERAEVAPVKWILWYLLGALGLAAVMIAFLQNWLRTGPAMFGMALTALLLAYGHRGTNRLRLHRLGREAVNFALPGETPPWQRFTAEVNRRIFRLHDHAAREAAAVLAAADEAMRQAALAAQEAAHAAEHGNNNSLSPNP